MNVRERARVERLGLRARVEFEGEDEGEDWGLKVEGWRLRMRVHVHVRVVDKGRVRLSTRTIVTCCRSRRRAVAVKRAR